MHVRRGTGKKHGRLARRIAAADHDDFLAGTQALFHGRGGKVQSRALEALVVGDRELAVTSATGGNDRVGVDCLAVIQAELKGLLHTSMLVTYLARTRRAPNFCACICARPASACPEMPVGKPR